MESSRQGVMRMEINMKPRIFILWALFLAVAPSDAGLVLFADSSAFDYQHEMNVNPSGQDLDGNTTADWFAGTAGGVTIPQTFTAGVAYSNQGAATPEILFRTDFTGSITRSSFSDTAPMTLEVRVSKVSGTQGSIGWFGLALQMPTSDHSIVVALADDRVKVRESGGTYVEYLNGTDFTSGFHTVRVAKESGNAWYVWVNQTLLNADLNTPIIDGNGSFNVLGAWFIGDYSGTGYAGDWAVDYIRLEKDGAYAIPEPATFSLVLTALGAACIRRRKDGCMSATWGP